MGTIHHPTTYQVAPVGNQIPPHLTTGKDLVLAWARHRASGEPRYIGELRREETGQKCGCECYSCGLELEAVNAGKTEFERRPHFRHPDGAPKRNCLVLSARAAALQMLLRDGELHLPCRRKPGKVEGLSGQYYQAWVTGPKEIVRIADYHLEDRVNALVTLDDGRQVRLSMVGSVEATSQDDVLEITPTIRLIVDDPAIGELSPEELRKRLTLIIDDGRWCSHWLDQQLETQALVAAAQKAADAMDWLDTDVELPKGISNELKRETLLHIKAKEILEQKRQIRLPTLTATSRRDLPSGKVIERISNLKEEMVRLESVALEQHLGTIKPDVLATTIAMGDWPADTLSIEITVTNAIDEERLERIRKKGLPTLEIDVSRMGGIVTLEEFKSLIVHETAAKRWLYHPWLRTEKLKLDGQIAIDVAIAIEEQQRKAKREQKERELMQLPIAELGNRYLSAVETYGKLRARADDVPDGKKVALAKALEQVHELAKIFAKRGYSEAEDEVLFRDRGSILDRLMSIKHDKGVGYKLDNAGQVINAILQEGKRYSHWHTLYLIAIRVYEPPLTEKQEKLVNDWKEEVAVSLREGKREFRRSDRFDRLLSLLFPEMAARINAPLPCGNLALGDDEIPMTPDKYGEIDRSGSRRYSMPSQVTWRTGRVNWYSSFLSRRKDPRWGEVVDTGSKLRDDGYDVDHAIEECARYFGFPADLIIIAWSEANLIDQDKMLRGQALENWERMHPDSAKMWFGE